MIGEPDSRVTRGLTGGSKRNVWALDKDARIRLWPAGSPWIRPGTFAYPARQAWFASATQMANEPVHVDGGDKPGKKSVYYHYGLDIGGPEGLVDIVAATDAVVVSRGKEVLDAYRKHAVVHPRYDVLYLRDGRGWYYRYSHLQSIDPVHNRPNLHFTNFRIRNRKPASSMAQHRIKLMKTADF